MLSIEDLVAFDDRRDAIDGIPPTDISNTCAGAAPQLFSLVHLGRENSWKRLFDVVVTSRRACSPNSYVPRWRTW